MGCTKSSNRVDSNSPSGKTELKEETVSLALKGCSSISFNNDHLTLCLDSVSDSRCPLNVVCAWAGTAIATLKFTKNEQVYPVTLAIPEFASYQQKITVAGYTIKLINVTPYPIAPPFPNPSPIEPAKVEIEISN